MLASALGPPLAVGKYITTSFFGLKSRPMAIPISWIGVSRPWHKLKRWMLDTTSESHRLPTIPKKIGSNFPLFNIKNIFFGLKSRPAAIPTSVTEPTRRGASTAIAILSKFDQTAIWKKISSKFDPFCPNEDKTVQTESFSQNDEPNLDFDCQIVLISKKNSQIAKLLQNPKSD